MEYRPYVSREGDQVVVNRCGREGAKLIVVPERDDLPARLAANLPVLLIHPAPIGVELPPMIRAPVAMWDRREEVRISLVKLPVMQTRACGGAEGEDRRFEWRVAVRYGYFRLAWAFARRRLFRFTSGPFILALKLLFPQNVIRRTHFERPRLRTISDEAKSQEIFIPRQDATGQRDMAGTEIQLGAGGRQSHTA